HWRRTAELQAAAPSSRVLEDRLFVCDGHIITSAGIASGIDMALALAEQDHGPRLAAHVAREMVIYLRRNGTQTQQSVYLDFRSHLDPSVHMVQDWLASHPGEGRPLAALAKLAHMSPRNLTRTFRK